MDLVTSTPLTMHLVHTHTYLLLLSDAHKLHHEYVFVSLECVHFICQPPILPHFNRRLLLLLALRARGGPPCGLAPVDVLEGHATVPEKVLIGKLPSVWVDLPETLSQERL